MEIESDLPKFPDYKLSEQQFLIQHTNLSNEERTSLINELVNTIKTENLAPYYKYLQNEIKDFPYDESTYQQLASENDEQITELKSKIKEAEGEEETELDVTTTTTKLAEYYTKIIDRVNALETFKKVLELTSDTGKKIDHLLTMARINFFFNDLPQVGKDLDQISNLIEKGGDWERRNRYKAYNGIYQLATRNFGEAAKLLIDSLATFTSTELCSYEQIAHYAIVAGVISLDRVDLKIKIIDSPEILSIYSSAPKLEPILNLTNSLYTCQYNCFFEYLLQTYDQLLVPNKYLQPHANYFLREMRCKAYGQLLESYKSLSSKSMAQQFNISEDFLDQDLCRFIPNKKLHCVIDKVNGIIETNRPDNKNNQYHLLIKQGDGLLTKLQKYGAAVKLSGAERVV
ncbi:RPN7 [Candida pseudojiufengensis]|uniref:RPN7 n=1 Tax=Candida pseudojiufengensis TaxID=497109 RepID=UPI002225308A|nr:RPN7 [Candida pseudojiufengensis]KAI5961888.1 RPN7 [Candida pseudojiufengensis]